MTAVSQGAVMRLDPEPAAAPLEFQARVTTTTGNRPTVVVRGEVDRATVAEFTAALDTAIRLDSSIELDLSEMTYIDSAGLTALVPRSCVSAMRSYVRPLRRTSRAPITTSDFAGEPMNLALWIVAGLLAVIFLTAGAAKLILPKEKLAAKPGGGWVEDFSAGAVKAIGVLEVLAAVGLILPAALDIAPVLVPLAAVGLVLLMVGAIVTRLRRHDKVIVVNLIYLALAVFVAWGRFGPESFTGLT